jgi:two-component system, LytTR family, response regulator
MLKAIIIDDEKLARDLIKSFLTECTDIEVIKECEDGFDGLKSINEQKPDMVFLDVQMPKLTGLEILEVLDFKPAIVFTTAYDEYAIKAFEHNAADYLLKPFLKTRFFEAIEKVRDRIANRSEDTSQLNNLVQTLVETKEILQRIVVKTGSKIKVIPVETIIYLQADDDYVTIFTKEGKYLKEATMKYFESHLDPDKFIRIHRSYIVNINDIIQMELYEKESYMVSLRNGQKLNVSKSGIKRLKEMMKF